MPLSIMIVEDKWDIAHLFSLSLARSGFDTITFTEPLLALGHFKQYLGRYCLILLDMFMKDLNVDGPIEGDKKTQLSSKNCHDYRILQRGFIK
jgi:DNA-binding NtrC family response regulator